MTDTALLALLRVIVNDDSAAAKRILAESPQLAREPLASGATRSRAQDFYFDEIRHYAYEGDTALHLAAAGYRIDVIPALLGAGADVRARNRRGAEPLHYAADASPGTATWDPDAQAATIVALIRAGADPDALDKSGVTPLLRAVRTRGAAAVQALLEHGADPELANRRGHKPADLATRPTGRGGSGSPEAKEQQALIIQLLTDRSDTP
ncbi:MAG TPA: ankyrin repeat domain-containing protein [Mycobacteriales bacterium]|nr:ankyrin repeat domain-containing protein [Mycobacteriales bacterium]